MTGISTLPGITDLQQQVLAARAAADPQLAAQIQRTRDPATAALANPTPGIANPGPSPFIGLVQGPPPANAQGTQPTLTRPLLAGGHAERNHQATQSVGSAGATPTIPTYGPTAVTAINGTPGSTLDMLA